MFENGVLAGNYAQLSAMKVLPFLDGLKFDFIDGKIVPVIPEKI